MREGTGSFLVIMQLMKKTYEFPHSPGVFGDSYELPHLVVVIQLPQYPATIYILQYPTIYIQPKYL